MDAHHFKQIIGWLLAKGRDDADARTVAMILAKQLASNPDGDRADLIKSLLPEMLSKFASIVWPVLGQAIVKDRAKSWRIEHALGDSFSFADEKKPPILSLPEDILLAWCHEYPEVAPAFVATVVPVLTTQKRDAVTHSFHPLVKRLLDEFGERDDVLRKLVQNMHTFGWTGSRTTYYALYEQPLREDSRRLRLAGLTRDSKAGVNSAVGYPRVDSNGQDSGASVDQTPLNESPSRSSQALT
jgi:hypothetical protein